MRSSNCASPSRKFTNKLVLYLGVFLLYLVGERVMHALVTSEIVRKTQLEADQFAARQIQKTLQPETLEELAGYELGVLYEPFRAVEATTLT